MNDAARRAREAHNKKIVVGTRVSYSVQFLRSIGESPTSEAYRARGVVERIVDLGSAKLAQIKWDGGAEFPGRVNVENLAVC